jgi:parallel beta-helix repeat protein
MVGTKISNLWGSTLVVIVVLISSFTASGKVIYVDADAPGPFHTGSTWTYAYKHIQDALIEANFSVKPVEIHVAQGIYCPDETSTYPVGTGDRYATFQLINGVILKGGYAGNGQPDPDMRDFTIYETILSGDLNGDDGPNFTSNGENSYNVVTGSETDATAILDGFTITAGNANGYDVYCMGGGMFNIFSNPTVTNCTFSGNWATGSGGGMENVVSNPTLTNCIFSDNSTSWAGGGIDNVDIDNNPTLANCTFSGNSAEVGGGICNYDCSPILTNCTFSGNWATGSGGGMINWDHSNPTVTNCTFSGNSANWEGGGMTNRDNSNPALTNCILWGNTALSGAQIHKEVTCFVTITYSDTQDGWPGQGNINTDPYFADATNGDFHLKSEAGRWNPDSESWIIDNVTSQCIDAGDPTSDWKAELWPHGCRINMGAYGGMPEASMSRWDAGSVADIDVDGQIGGKDIKLLIDKWLFEEVLLPEDLNRDGIVNFIDHAILANNFNLLPLPSQASNPTPVDGKTVVNTITDLNWTAGLYVTSHDVYFGTSNPLPLIGNQTTTTFDPGEMDYSTTYYWRIDEVNSSGTTTGIVWSFTTISSPPPPPP